MQRALSLAFAVLLAAGSSLFADTPYPHIAPTDPKTPAEELKTFKVPKGFEVQLVASEPDIRKPIQMAFDAKGRLWVTTSEEYPFPAVGRPGKDRLYVLEDFGPDGKAKKVSIFADDLNIPIGVLPLPDCKSVIVSSIEPAPDDKTPATCWIWKLTDTDGDGKYDKKEKLCGPFGCRDTHGMNNSYTLMPDGWVYACHGYLNDSRPKGKDGHEIFMNSGNTFRFRLDGSRIENWTYGQVNPFGIAVDPYFNLYTADCHSRPITQLIRGATYQSFSKPHDGIGFAPHVTIHGHDSTALCGLVYYAADHFPKEYLDCMFLGNVTSNCINWDKIEFKGSTPVGIDKEMFLSSSDYWFRPTDIKLGPDGALYFADFYNKIIGHYEVDLKHPQRDKLRGRVWRIIWKGEDGKGEAPKMMADLTRMPIKDVHKSMGHRNLAVRMLAAQQVFIRAEEFERLLDNASKKKVDYEVEFDDPAAGDLLDQWRNYHGNTKNPYANLAYLNLRNFADDWEPSHLSNYLQIVGNHPDWKPSKGPASALRKEVLRFLMHKDWFVRRATVEALTAHADGQNVMPLVKLLWETPKADENLIYAIRVALRESLRPLDDWDKAAGENGWSDKAILALADIAPAVPTAAASAFLVKHFDALATERGRLPGYVEHASRYAANDAAMKQILDFMRGIARNDVAFTISLLRGMNQGVQKRGGKLSEEAVNLADSMAKHSLGIADPPANQAGIDLANEFKLASAFDRLLEISKEKSRPEAQRGSSLQALAAIDAGKAQPVLITVLKNEADPIAIREKAAQILAGSNRNEALDELVKELQAAPARLQTVIAQALAGNPRAAQKLLKAVEEGKASARLLQDKTVQTKLNESRVPKANERIAALTKGLPSADEKMLELIKQRSGAFAKAKPDAVLGKVVFTKNCGICHQIGNEGVKIGPQLDGIGGRGLDRLLEDILDPSRNVDAAFRQTTLMLKDGKSLPGLVLREEGQIVVLADDKGKEIKVPKDDIDSRRTSLLSPMPANLYETIPEKDFHDLMAYLLTQRAKN
jgi:putative heme-binding domain-containing protein